MLVVEVVVVLLLEVVLDVVVVDVVVVLLDVVVLVDVLVLEVVDVVVVVTPVISAMPSHVSASLKIAKSSPSPFKSRPHSQKSLAPGFTGVGVSSSGSSVTLAEFTKIADGFGHTGRVVK